MTVSGLTLEQKVLRLLSPTATDQQALVAALSDEDWHRIVAWAKEHRFAPLLHYMLFEVHKIQGVPVAIKNTLVQLRKKGVMRGLGAQREVLRISQILHAAGIDSMFLKGSYLGQFVYPAAGLRAIRDIDVLVAPTQVLRAQKVLLAGGLQPHPKHPGDADAALELGKHLPPMLSPSGVFPVELHERILPRELVPEGGTDISQGLSFWPNAIAKTVVDQQINFASATELLFHLSVHSVYDHKFNNGPLIFSDIGFLLQSHPIDWSLFWQLCQTYGVRKGVILLLKVVEGLWRDLPIEWPVILPHELPSVDLIQDTEQLSLRGLATRGDVTLFEAVQTEISVRKRTALLARRIFPNRAMIARAYPVRAGSIKVFMYYPLWWWRLATERLPSLMRSGLSTRSLDETARLRNLRAWLRD